MGEETFKENEMNEATIKFLIAIMAISGIALVCGICILAAINKPDKKNEPTRPECPNCGLPFSDWFWWPGKGNYCWPCYKKHGYIITAKEPK